MMFDQYELNELTRALNAIAGAITGAGERIGESLDGIEGSIGCVRDSLEAILDKLPADIGENDFVEASPADGAGDDSKTS